MFRFGWTLVLIYFYLTHTSSAFGRSFTQMDIIISLVPRLPSLRLSVRVCCEVMADKSLDWIYQKLLWRFIPPHFAISPGNFFFAPSRYGKLLIFHLHSFIIFFVLHVFRHLSAFRAICKRWLFAKDVERSSYKIGVEGIHLLFFLLSTLKLVLLIVSGITAVSGDVVVVVVNINNTKTAQYYFLTWSQFIRQLVNEFFSVSEAIFCLQAWNDRFYKVAISAGYCCFLSVNFIDEISSHMVNKIPHFTHNPLEFKSYKNLEILISSWSIWKKMWTSKFRRM